MFGEMYRSLEILKLSKLFAYLSLLAANFYSFIEWKVAVEARDYSKELGMDHWIYGHNLMAKYPAALLPGDNDLSMLVDDLLSLPESFAVKVMDVMVYINKPFLEGIKAGLIEAAYQNDTAALNLLILYTIVCVKQPEKIFEMPEPFRSRTLKRLKENHGIDMTRGRNMPDWLLSVLININWVIIVVILGVFFSNTNFFFQTHLGNLLFIGLFLSTYWGAKYARFLRRITLMKLYYPPK